MKSRLAQLSQNTQASTGKRTSGASSIGSPGDTPAFDVDTMTYVNAPYPEKSDKGKENYGPPNPNHAEIDDIKDGAPPEDPARVASKLTESAIDKYKDIAWPREWTLGESPKLQ